MSPSTAMRRCAGNDPASMASDCFMLAGLALYDSSMSVIARDHVHAPAPGRGPHGHDAVAHRFASTPHMSPTAKAAHAFIAL